MMPLWQSRNSRRIAALEGAIEALRVRVAELERALSDPVATSLRSGANISEAWAERLARRREEQREDERRDEEASR